MFSDEEAKLGQVALKTSEKVGGFLARYIGGSLEQGMGIFEDKLKYMRWERRVRLMVKADEFLKEVGLAKPNREIPMKFAIPLFQSASLEDDDELQDRWAALLVNAGNENSGIELKRAHISVLEQITPLEAQILEKIYSLPYEKTNHLGVLTKDLPEDASVAPIGELEAFDSTDEVQLAISNLARLGCITLPTSWGGGEIFERVVPTLFGKFFIEACTLQKGGSDSSLPII